jgi:hypothetical protein
MEKFKFKFFQKENENIIWTNAVGVEIPVTRLRNGHIYNIIGCLRGQGNRTIPEMYNGKSHEQWLQIMNNELNRRHA